MLTTRRLVLVLVTVLFLMSMLPGALLSLAPVPAAHASAVQPMLLISRNVATNISVPAYASSGTAADGNSSDYSSPWSASTNASWLAYDLSSVPSARRGQVVVAWYNDPYTSDYWQGGGIGNSYYNLPQNYTLDANAAPGGITAPTSGWVTLATVTGNNYSGRTQSVNMTGYNWLRINITSSIGGAAAIKMDVYDASQAQQDTYLMLGDSITAEGMAHSNIDLSGPWNGGNLTQLINASNSAYYPSIVDGGTGGVTARWGATYISSLLAPYSGRYVALAYGTNDANQSGALTSDQIASYYKSMVAMVDAVQARGMVAIVPHIPWGCASGGMLGTNAKTLNDYIDAHLYTDRPGVIRGPDLWTFFFNHQNLLQDCIHPTYAESGGQLSGFEQLQRQWRDALLANVYSAVPSATPTPTKTPASTPTQTPTPLVSPTVGPSVTSTQVSTATPTPTSGGISWVRGADTSPAGATSSPSVTLNGVATGDLLVVSLNVGAGHSETATNGVTSTGPSAPSWSQAVSAAHGQSQIDVWYAFASVPGMYTVTGHITASTATGIAIDEYNGVSQASPVLTTGSGGGSGTDLSASSAVTVPAGSLVFGSVTWNTGNRTLTAGSGFSMRQKYTSGNKNQPIGVEDTVIPTSAVPLANWTLNSSETWTAAMAAFSH